MLHLTGTLQVKKPGRPSSYQKRKSQQHVAGVNSLENKQKCQQNTQRQILGIGSKSVDSLFIKRSKLHVFKKKKSD